VKLRDLNPLRRSRRASTYTYSVQLQTLRFRNLLRNARAIHEYVADGEEKLAGEFIFDRRFVISLTDAVLESLGRIVFDASLLSPPSARRLYALYDELKGRARRVIAGSAEDALPPSRAPLDQGFDQYPEFGMLRRAHQWMVGAPGAGSATVTSLIRMSIDESIQALEAAGTLGEPVHALRLAAGGVVNQFLLAGHGGGIRAGADTQLDLRDLLCKPLGLMLIGWDARQAGSGDPGGEVLREWHGLAGEEELDLWSTDRHIGLRLHATLGGQPKTDFIFLFAKPPLDLQGLVPEGLKAEQSDSGSTCWWFEQAGVTLDAELMRLGKWFFGRTKG
jgi:hypothetical protein